MDGHEVGQRLRRLSSFDQTPPVALTGYGKAGDRSCRNHGLPVVRGLRWKDGLLSTAGARGKAALPACGWQRVVRVSSTVFPTVFQRLRTTLQQRRQFGGRGGQS